MSSTEKTKGKSMDTEEKLAHTKIGIQICMDHIDIFLKDSKLLIKKKRYSASVRLSILAIEEICKVHIMSESISLQKPLSDKIWEEITTAGRAHVMKVASLIHSRKLHLANITPESDRRFDEFMHSIGISIGDKKSSQTHNKILKILFLRLETLKQDCFYTGLDENKNWINFDNRFSDKIKKAIAVCFFIIALRMHSSLKFSLSLPRKSFDKYSVEEQKILKSRWMKEVGSIMKKTDTKELGHLTDIAIMVIMKTYPPDKRGLVTETDGNIFDF
jgi:AbiV family abortive infection protein